MAFEPKRPDNAHEYYSELCALFTSGSLTDAELSELNAHVRDCQSCATLLSSYRAVARSVSALAPAAEETALPQKPAWVENAKKRLLNSIEADRTVHSPQLVTQRAPASWNSFWMFRPLTAAAVVLLAALLAGFTYHLGRVRGQATLQSSAPAITEKSESNQ